MCPLSDIVAGASCTVERIQGNRDILGRLMAMGILPGTELRIIRNDAMAPVLVMTLDSRMALDVGQVGGIWVTERGKAV